jgi:hypothetical protein
MIFDNFPNPARTTILPPNYRRGEEVNKYVEHYADSQLLKVKEALAVQGSDIVVWNRQLGNRYCTCQDLESVINNNPAAIEERPLVIAEVKKREISQIGTTPKVVMRSKSQLGNLLQEANLKDLSGIVEGLYEDVPELTLYQGEPSEKLKGTTNSALEEAFIRQKENLGTENAEHVNCPICFGTRRSDSYQPHKGSRLVLDASDFYKQQLTGVSIDRTNFPYRFRFLGENSSILWELSLPKYFKVVSIKAYNMENITTAVDLTFDIDKSNNFNSLSLDNLQARSGLNNNVTRVKATYSKDRVSKNLQTIEPVLTHLEIVILYSNTYEKGELPLLNIPEHIDYQEMFLRSRIVLSPETPLYRNDLISENKYGLLWQVVDLDKSNTNTGKPLRLSASIRLVQNSERLYNLSVFTKKLTQSRLDYTSAS